MLLPIGLLLALVMVASPAFALKTGILEPQGDIDMSSNKSIINLRTPVASGEAVNKSYVDGLIQGVGGSVLSIGGDDSTTTREGDTIKVKALGITAAQLAAGAVTTAKIGAGAVTTDEIGAGAVTNDKLAGSISDDKLNSITTAGKVSGSAITSGTISGSTIIGTSGTIESTAGGIKLPFGGTMLVATKRAVVQFSVGGAAVAIAHNLGETYVKVEVYDAANQMIWPDSITLTDDNTVTLDLSSYTVGAGWKAIVMK